jgi:hypothetical protein
MATLVTGSHHNDNDMREDVDTTILDNVELNLIPKREFLGTLHSLGFMIELHEVR